MHQPDTQHNLEVLRFRRRNDVLCSVASIRGVCPDEFRNALQGVEVFFIVLLGLAAVVRIRVTNSETQGAGSRYCQWTGHEGCRKKNVGDTHFFDVLISYRQDCFVVLT